MDKYLRTILSNTVKHEARHTLYDDDIIVEIKIDRLNTLCNFQKIIENYDELEPMLKKFFIEKAEREKWEERD